MYRYMCVVCENVDKNAFYDVISEIKSLYLNCTEIPYTGSEKSEMGQILSIPGQHGDESKIYIKYEYDKRRVTVLSETYLSQYYEGKKVDEVILYSGNGFGKGKEIGLSIAFLIVNIIASHMLFWVFDWRIEPNLMISVVLAVIYALSSFYIKKKWNTGTFKTLFIQMGGIPFCIAILLAIAYIIIDHSWDALAVLIEIISFFRIVPAALAICRIITLVISTGEK